MEQDTNRRVHRVTAMITFVAFVFFLFFQVNKSGPLGEINPFGEDPYDAVGSFAIQIALLTGVLTYARALRLTEDPEQAAKRRLVLRGNALVLLAIGITLVVDAIAIRLHPVPPSYWGIVLKIELTLMSLLVITGVLMLAVLSQRTPTSTPPRDLTPADGIDDLLTLVRVPVRIANAFLPDAFVEWVLRFDSDGLFSRAPWLNPRTHPWRFACILGLLVGVGLLLAQLQEGLPPSLMIGLIVAGIFISAEFIATLVGFLLLGGYLGLRPSINLDHGSS
jgi:hypothetical protein